MGKGLLQPGDPAIDFSLPDVASDTPRALSSCAVRQSCCCSTAAPGAASATSTSVKCGKRYPEIRDKGGEVVAVYPGKPAHLRPYYLERKIPFPLLADEQGTAIDAYGVRNTWALFHRGIPHPATYVIDGAGVVRFADVRRQHFFRVPVGTLVAKIGELSASGGVLGNAVNESG